MAASLARAEHRPRSSRRALKRRAFPADRMGMGTKWNVSGGGRRRCAFAVNALLAMAVIPMLVWTAPESRWTDPVLLGALAAIAVASYLSAVSLSTGLRWDAGNAVALIALVAAGPLPACAVWLVPEVIDLLMLRRRRLLSYRPLGTIATMGWPLLAAQGVLNLAGVHRVTLAALPIIWLCGLVLLLGNQTFTMVTLTHTEGVPLRRVLASLRGAAAGDQVLLALGTITAALMVPLGYGALMMFSVIVLVPRATITMLARARSIARLSQSAATAVYCQALSAALRMDRDGRRTLLAVLAVADQHDARTRRDDARSWTPTKVLIDRFTEVMSAAWMMGECWDGSGPAHVQGPCIPIYARVANVAQAWSALTAAGGPELSHESALAQLRAQAGGRLDPHIVETMAEVIELERCLTLAPAAQPRVYRLPLPRRWRELIALRVGGRRATSA